MTVPLVSSRVVPMLTGGLFVVRVHCDGAGSGRVGGVAVSNGIRTPSAQGKTGSAFTARLVAVPGTCANDEKVITEVARTAASDNEADLYVSIVRFYSTHSCDVNLRNQQKKVHARRIGASSERNGADAAFSLCFKFDKSGFLAAFAVGIDG